MTITELKYSNTNTYLIEGDKGTILFDTGWAGTFVAFCSELGEKHKALQDIDYLLISHFHPDHMGIAGEIAECGPKVLIMDLQLPYIHSSDVIFGKENNRFFKPISEKDLKVISVDKSRAFLTSIGINGEIIYTPGHSDDSIPLYLDDGSLFVGDLNPLYELDMHKGTDIEKSWNNLLRFNPSRIYYGHAKTATIAENDMPVETEENDEISSDGFGYKLVSRVIKYIDKGYNVDRIRKKTGADRELIEDINRMYLTHPGASIQGILDRIEIKNR
jgi:glyoxylase-like metal-dependent hydrolase (beta-lactamase superfamily II)